MYYIDFTSRLGTHYRIEINTPQNAGHNIQLLAGENPLVIDEDNSDDFFAPIRTQTGTLQLCTQLPNGSMLSIDDILPSSNTSTSVQLFHLGDDDVEVYDWQGFLSCEAYTQDFTTMPQILELPVISVLEAFDSIDIPDSMNDYKSILYHTISALKYGREKAKLPLDFVFIDKYFYSILSILLIYGYTLFSEDEFIDKETVTYETRGKSIKSVLSMICTTFGYTMRECGTNLYIARQDYIHEGLYKIAYTELLKILDDAPYESVRREAINATGTSIKELPFAGDSHTFSIKQGAKRVTVNAGIDPFELKLDIPECPYYGLEEIPAERKTDHGVIQFYNGSPNSLVSLRYYKITWNLDFSEYDKIKESNVSAKLLATNYPYKNSCFWETPILFSNEKNTEQTYSFVYDAIFFFKNKKITNAYTYASAFFARWKNAKQEFEPVLVISGFPRSFMISQNEHVAPQYYETTQENYVYKQTSLEIACVKSGYIKLSLDIVFAHTVWKNKAEEPIRIYHDFLYTLYPTIRIAVQFGNKWLKKTDVIENNNLEYDYTFEDDFQYFDLDISNDYNKKELRRPVCNYIKRDFVVNGKKVELDDSIFIPITQKIEGNVTIYFYPHIYMFNSKSDNQSSCKHEPATEYGIRKLDIKHEDNIDNGLSDRKENTYSRSILNLFKEEKTIDVPFATSIRNIQAKNMIYFKNEPLETISMFGKDVRLEENLLERLKTYYEKSRKTITTNIAHVKNEDYNTSYIIDGDKNYVPLSVSRDYGADVNTLTLFELP